MAHFLHPRSFLDLVASILALALISLILIHKNLTSDINAAGDTFSGALLLVENG